MNVRELKCFDEKYSLLDDLILAQDALMGLSSGYQNIGVPVPDWVVDKSSLVAKEIATRRDGGSALPIDLPAAAVLRSDRYWRGVRLLPWD